MANVIYFLYRTICTYNYVHMVIMPYTLTEQEPVSVRVSLSTLLIHLHTQQ